MGRPASSLREPTAPERLLRDLIRYSARLHRDAEHYFARYGISGAQWGAMRTLHRAEVDHRAGLWLKELGERMLVQPPSMTNVIEGLVRAGYVRKQASSRDRRAKEVSLTPAGRRLVERVLRRHPDRVRSVVGSLDEQETRSLLRLVEKLSDRLAVRERRSQGN